MDIVDAIIEFESGQLTDEETIELFQELISSGKISALQGSYQRMAAALIEDGYCRGPEVESV